MADMLTKLASLRTLCFEIALVAIVFEGVSLADPSWEPTWIHTRRKQVMGVVTSFTYDLGGGAVSSNSAFQEHGVEIVFVMGMLMGALKWILDNLRQDPPYKFSIPFFKFALLL
ncbi:hypothetical protein Nepgr_012206 [Nepenthes gracilis]|uniref:Uncharacterized protein n=1 Tax=Nepenthes gracilis TaxID=150966 RepID=A0AAD3XN55_NEPGR|nr:hypothetical protein Nepgr_012206 [Nepenthes gracilis]